MTTSATQEHVPVEDWPDVSQMLDGFGDPALPESSKLVGKILSVRFENDETLQLSFLSETEVVLTASTFLAASEEPLPYRAVDVRDEILYVDFTVGAGAHTHDCSFVVHLTEGIVTLADSFMHDVEGTIRTTTDFHHGQLEGTGAIQPRERTDELVGRRIYYRYSPTEHYEHIYLSPGTFVWHCVKGGEKGLADADQTKAFSLGEDLVIFYWKETVMPVESFLVIDFQHNRSLGRMFCWEASSMDVVHLPFDSKFTVLNETTYPID